MSVLVEFVGGQVWIECKLLVTVELGDLPGGLCESVFEEGLVALDLRLEFFEL